MTRLFSLLIFVLTLSSLKAQTGDTVLSYAIPTKYEIAGIRVTGDESEKTTVLSLCGLATGQKISIPGEDITDALRNIWKQGLFSDVKILLDKTEDNKAWLNIYVQTRPRISRYSISGLSKAQAGKIKEEVHISTGAIVTEQYKQGIIKRVDEFYTKKGFPNSSVVFTEKPDTSFGKNKILLDVKINKGKRVKISEIVFEGNEIYPDKKFYNMMKKTKRKMKYNIFRASKFLPEEYEADKERIVDFYHGAGYKDARIVSDSVIKVSDDLIKIKINIFEGDKYYYRNVAWSGNTKYDAKTLNSILAIKKGDVYNPQQLESRLFINQSGVDVTSLYMDDGYLFFSLTPVETRIENDSIDLEVRISEGPQATIDKIKITGNTKTHDQVILREMRTRPGQKFSRSDVIRTQRELSQIGYFDPAKMNVIPTPNPRTGTVDLEYIVEEKPSDQIELSGGWGAGQLVGVLGLTLNNFSTKNIFKPKRWQGYPSGDGQKLSIRAYTSGKFYQSYNMSFTEPWFGGKKPISFSISPYHSEQSNGLPSYDPSRYTLKITGITLGLGKRLKWPDDYFVLNHSLSYQYYDFKNYPYLIKNFQTGVSNNLYFRHALVRNGLQGGPIYPTGGAYLSMSLQWTLPYSAFIKKDYEHLSGSQKYNLLEYHKWKLDASYYLSLDRKQKLVLMAVANYGLIGLYNRQIGLTPFERFYVGGDGLTGYVIDGRELIRLRGYKGADDILPSQGGTLYSRYTFELHYPITNSQVATIYGLGFVEGGNAWSSFKQYNPFELKKSAGVGVRVFLPMFGLLGFDWGYGFDPTVNNPGIPSGSHFHFYIGQPLY
ncbi:MAG: outer membrane protein assembly factor BamA [Bacteroidetes bacterium]|nr:outer membrane protein assembly factor BamA [Bacteroidota bacterium]